MLAEKKHLEFRWTQDWGNPLRRFSLSCPPPPSPFFPRFSSLPLLFPLARLCSPPSP
jgi:hypothetical protein